MADKEFTQICKEILGVSKRLEKIEPDELRKIKADIEQISATIAAHKASFDASKEDFDGKYSGITEIINTFNTLKAQIEQVLKSGTINDGLETSVSTFSSKKIMELLVRKLDATAKAADSDKLDGLDSSAFARIEQVLVKRPLPKGDYTSVGFWRALDSGWYSYNHDSIQGSNNPTPYGFIYVLVEGSDYRVFWYRKNGIEIYSLFFNGSQSSSSSAGWNLVSTTITSGSYASTGVMRTENGDFSGRWISADHFKLKAETQDNLFGNSSELVFRNGAGENENFLRAVSADKLRETLKLFRLDRRNATSVYTASQANPIIDLSQADNFELTLTGSGVLALNNGIKGQSGVITISNAAANITGYASNVKWRTTPTSLQATETFAYFVWHDGHISIGRV